MYDLLLTGVVLVIVPAIAFRRTWTQRRSRRRTTRTRRYLQALALASVLSAAVLAEWRVEGRDWRALGLGLPLAGQIGLGVAALTLAAVGVAMRRAAGKTRRPDPEAMELLPVTTLEKQLFVVFSIGLGFGWELLYRGYLTWALAPHVGVAGAVLLSAGAYGVAHGYRGAKLFAGSLVSALIFTLAYVATHSLWWLMVIHAGLPLLTLGAASAASDSGEAAQPQAV